MKATRFIWFIIMIAAGIAIGLYYTWIVHPVELVDATFYDLRQDYKADYVLMTAEIYNDNPNLFQTMIRLDRLLEESPEIAVANAIRNANQLGYSETDIDMLYRLNEAIGGNEIETPDAEDIFIEFDPQTFVNTETAVPTGELSAPTVMPTEDNPFLDQSLSQSTLVPSDEPNPFGEP